MPAQIFNLLIAVFQLFCLGHTGLAAAHQSGPLHFGAAHHSIIFHNISGEEAPEYALGIEEAEDTDDDSNEVLKNILDAVVLRKTFLPVAGHEYSAIAPADTFYTQAPLFVLHGNFRV